MLSGRWAHFHLHGAAAAPQNGRNFLRIFPDVFPESGRQMWETRQSRRQGGSSGNSTVHRRSQERKQGWDTKRPRRETRLGDKRQTAGSVNFGGEPLFQRRRCFIGNVNPQLKLSTTLSTQCGRPSAFCSKSLSDPAEVHKASSRRCRRSLRSATIFRMEQRPSPS